MQPGEVGVSGGPAWYEPAGPQSFFGIPKINTSHKDWYLSWGELWELNPRPSEPQPDALTN